MVLGLGKVRLQASIARDGGRLREFLKYFSIMKKIFETGHPVNVTSWDGITEEVVGFGGNYAPTAVDLQVASILNLQTQLHQVMLDYEATYTLLGETINQRQEVFEDLMVRSMLIVSGAIACGADKKLIAEMRAVLRKLRGQRSKMIKEEEAETPTPETMLEAAPDAGSELAKIVKKSVSQRSYSNLTEHYRRLVEYVKLVPGYAANEANMTIVSLDALGNDAETATKQVFKHKATLENTRAMRDKLLYRSVTGAVYVADRIKHYVKTRFGLHSAEYAAVARYHFKKYDYEGM